MLSLKERLQQILIRDCVIKPQDLERALARQKRTGEDLGKVLIQLELISEEQLTVLLSEGLGVPPIDISRIKIDPDVVNILPKDIASKYQILPISKMGDNLTLAMADPLNIFAIDHVENLTNLHITPIIARRTQIEEMIERYFSSSSVEILQDIIHDLQGSEVLELVKDPSAFSGRTFIDDVTPDAPMIKFTDTILQQAISMKASDVFIEPMQRVLRVRYRVDGLLREANQFSKELHLPITSRLKVLAHLDIAERRLPQEGRFSFQMENDGQVDIRVSVLPTAFGEKAALRILDRTADILDIDELGLENDALRHLKECVACPHGLVLSCGPTGSGKTTTMYSLLRSINTPTRNIVTVEDPIEYEIKGVNQVNVRPSMNLTFANTLRAVLRQDPDVIMIGEIRDAETLDIAVKAALTGHLVLSTLHTSTAAGSLIRLMNMGVRPFLLVSSLIGVVGQRLVRKICSKCREQERVSEELIELYQFKRFAKGAAIRLFRGRGCARCSQSGYEGRVALTEILMMTPLVKELILHRSGELQIKTAGRQEGMVTMREDGLQKALSGITTLQEVLRVTAGDE